MRSKLKRCARRRHSWAAAVAGMLVSGEERVISSVEPDLDLGKGTRRTGGSGGSLKVGGCDVGVKDGDCRDGGVTGRPSATSSSLRLRKVSTVCSLELKSDSGSGAVLDSLESLAVLRSDTAPAMGVSGASRLRCFCDFILAIAKLSGGLGELCIVPRGRNTGEASGVKTPKLDGRAGSGLSKRAGECEGEVQSLPSVWGGVSGRRAEKMGNASWSPVTF